MSVVGDCKIVRHLYLPAPGLSYLVYTAAVLGKSGDMFLLRAVQDPDDFIAATIPRIGTEIRVPVPPATIKNFSAIETDVVNEVLFLYDDGKDIFSFIYNPVADVLTQSVVKEFAGQVPVLENDGVIRSMFVRDLVVKLRNDLALPELDIVEPSATVISDIDIVLKDGSVVHYAGRHSPLQTTALPLAVDAQTEMLWNGEQGVIASVTSAFEDVITGGNYAVISESAQYVPQISMPGGGIQGDGVVFPGGAGLVGKLRAEGNFWQAGLNEITVMVWAYGDPAFPLNSTFFNGAGINTHLPWSDSNIYWDAPYPDRINYNAGTTTEGAWRHWVFTKNIGTGIMRIYRDGVQQLQGAGKTLPMNGGSFFTLAHNWNGWISELAIADKELTQPEIAAARVLGLAGTPLSLGSVPDLIHYWPLNDAPGSGFVDQSGNGFHGPVLGQGFLILPGFDGVVFLVDGSSIPIENVPVGSAITIDGFVRPRLNGNNSYIVNGNLRLRILNNGRLEFIFQDTSLVTFRQTSDNGLKPGVLSHVAVSHTFGAGGGTFLMINGEVVQGDWFNGTGNENPGLGPENLRSELGQGDHLQSLKISNVARSVSYIRNYIRGRT